MANSKTETGESNGRRQFTSASASRGVHPGDVYSKNNSRERSVLLRRGRLLLKDVEQYI